MGIGAMKVALVVAEMVLASNGLSLRSNDKYVAIERESDIPGFGACAYVGVTSEGNWFDSAECAYLSECICNEAELQDAIERGHAPSMKY